MTTTKQTYRDNPLLKRVGVNLQYTQEQIDEYVKCSKDPIYFAKYIKIITLDYGLVPFEMYDFQKEMISTFHNNRFVITKCPRQVGKTTTSVCYLLWTVLFQDSQNIAILANKGTTARDILGKLQLAYENLPIWLQQGVTDWNKSYIELENGSKITASSTSSSAARSGSYNCVDGDSITTVKINGIIFDISLKNLYDLIANSSEYVYNNNNGVDEYIHRQQIHKVVLSKNERSEEKLYSLEQGKDENILRRNSIENEKCKIESIQILTESGFKDFDGIKKTKNQKTIKIITSNSVIICTPDHKIFTSNGYLEAKYCLNKKIVNKNNQYEYVNYIEDNENIDVYDLLEVKDTHSYYCNGILVHQCVFLDEFAFVPSNIATEFFTSVYPVITSGTKTKIIIVSTPNGMNLFYKLWVDSINKRNNYVSFEVHWSQVPGRDDQWKEETIKNTSEHQFQQEFESVDFTTLVNNGTVDVSIGDLYEQLKHEQQDTN
jgi:hypothetical protein